RYCQDGTPQPSIPTMTRPPATRPSLFARRIMFPIRSRPEGQENLWSFEEPPSTIMESGGRPVNAVSPTHEVLGRFHAFFTMTRNATRRLASVCRRLLV